jgi:hypothetical protein
MIKKHFKLMAALLLPLAVSAQTSIFNDGEATTGAIRNLAHNASTGTEATIYNPAGLSFAPGKFAISVNGMAHYQNVLCSPYSFDENGGIVYGWEQNATLRGISPSVQGYAKINKGTISFSYANEGGVKWTDPNGDIFTSYILESNSQLEEFSTGLCDALRDMDFLANDDDYLHWSTSNYVSHSYNRCVRLGGSYDLGEGFAAYMGVRYNHIKSSVSSDNDLFVFMPSKNEKMGFVDYLTEVVKAKSLGNYTEEMEQLIDSVDLILHNGIQVSTEYPSTELYAFSPVVGLGFNYKTLNVGMKYEMSTSIYNETGSLFCPHVFSAGVSNLFWKRLLVSASADLRWGFKGNDVLRFVAENKPFIYQLGLGFDFDVTDSFKISASAAGCNAANSTKLMGITNEYICSSQWNWKASCGAQCKIGDNFLVDFGVMMNLKKVTDNEAVTINGGIHRNCEFQYGYRFASGIGLTYVFN